MNLYGGLQNGRGRWASGRREARQGLDHGSPRFGTRPLAMKPRALRTTGMVAVSVLLGLFIGTPAALADDEPQVTLCHATGAVTNPYGEKTVDQSSILKPAEGNKPAGHGHHTGPIFNTTMTNDSNWGDIIPAFPGYGGQNVSAGQAWLDRGCEPAPEDTTVDIDLDKSAVLTDVTAAGNVDNLADAGEEIQYSFVVTNTGNVRLTAVTLTDAMLAAAGSAVSCPLTRLDAGETMTCSATYIVTNADVADGELIHNVATARGTSRTGVEVTATDDARTGTNEPVEPAAAISVVKTYTLHDSTPGTAGKADADETIDYSFEVTNTGNVRLTAVIVADAMLDAAVAGDAVTCSPDVLEPDDTVTCTAAAYVVKASDVANGAPIVNVAIASGKPPYSERVSAEDRVSTPTKEPSVAPRMATLTLVKVVVNTGGGNASASAWTLDAVGGPTAFAEGPSGTNQKVEEGIYTLTESGSPTGYTASGWDCGEGRRNVQSVTINYGDVTCTITNTFTRTVVPPPSLATLTLIKVVVNTGGGNASPSAWTLDALGGPTAFAEGPSGTSQKVEAGTYTLTESGPAGYTASPWSCTYPGAIGSTVNVGTGDVTCTITNTYIPRPPPPVTPPITPVAPPVIAPVAPPVIAPVAPPVIVPVAPPAAAPIPTVVPRAPAGPVLAVTGAESIPLGLSGLLVLALGALLTVAGRYSGRHRTGE